MLFQIKMWPFQNSYVEIFTPSPPNSDQVGVDTEVDKHGGQQSLLLQPIQLQMEVKASLGKSR